jgi:hypothetical protein
MGPIKVLATTFCLTMILGAQQVAEDPVMRARAQRGPVADGDLPPVPRTVMEPPPLPPPEAHARDSRQASKGKKKVATKASMASKKNVKTSSKTASPKRSKSAKKRK